MEAKEGRADFGHLYRAIVRLIADGAYRPGERIGIRDLSVELGVSPTPIREILSRLVGRGVVDERRSEGYYLVSLEVRDIEDLYRLHALCTDTAIRELTWPPPFPDERFEDAWTLWAYFATATGNLVLRDVQQYLEDRLRLVRRCEPSLFEDARVEADRFLTFCREPSPKMLRGEAAAFYRKRIAAAQSLALLARRS
jgi:DNA-binding transcriptional MocR family regulator